MKLFDRKGEEHHPSRKHDVDAHPTVIIYHPSQVYSDTSGTRRRDRRKAQIAELKANRRSRRA